jgi:hypothetical protein
MNINKVLKTIETDFKGKAFDETEHVCQYKTNDGKKCLIGLFIPKGHIGENFVGGVHALLYCYPDLKKHMPSQNIGILEKLQERHDASELNTEFNNIDSLTLDEQKFYLQLNALDLLG